MKINVLGSCVSRVSLLKGDQTAHGIVGDCGLELEYFLDKHNIALAMMPPPFSREEVMSIRVDELWDKTRLRSLQQSLMKDTVSMLMESEAEWLVMDLYDFHNSFYTYNNTAFASQSNEIARTELFKSHSDEIKPVTWFELPTWIYYPYVDLFFEKILQKYDANHIILNRFRANTYFLFDDGIVYAIPDDFKLPSQCNDKYNNACYELEQYIIDKYNPYVIDISPYFMGDANIWSNLNGAHFEKEFYRETYSIILEIINGNTDKRYFNKTKLFDRTREGFEEDKKRCFNVDKGLELMECFVEIGEVLWINLLDKLYAYAPEHPKVKQYMAIVAEEGYGEIMER